MHRDRVALAPDAAALCEWQMKRRSRKVSSRKKPQSAAVRPARWWPTLAICGALVFITWIVFGRTIGFDFVNYDDSFYVYQNPAISNGLTREGLTRAFTQPLVGNWHPLT